MSDNETASATPDELGVFIDSDGSYRILIPNKWNETGQEQITEFAYLVIAAVLRLARKSEREFARELSRWALEDLRKTGELNVTPVKKPGVQH